MTSEQGKNIHFFLNDNNQTKSNESNIYKDFIIQTNITTNSKNLSLEKENITLTEELRNKEDEVDTLEEHKRYIKNEIKNFMALSNLNKKITNNVKNKEQLYLKYNNNCNDILKTILYLYICYNIILLFSFSFLEYLTTFSFISVLTNIMSITPIFNYIIYKKFNKSRLLHKIHQENISNENLQIKKHESDIKDIEYTNDFIEKYIDNL